MRRTIWMALMWLVVPAAVVVAQHTHPAPATPAAAGADPPAAASRPAIAAGAPPFAADTPIQCWWRSSSGAIRLGEVVDVSLTCAVLESEVVTAVADESRLTVAAVQLTPFEIVDGTHPPDVRDGDHRFFQYRYRLRLINPDAIGHDVKLPPLVIQYKLQSRTGAGASLAGRDLVHQMPQLIFRVVSQVPADADDIRDSADASFAEIEGLRFRARTFNVAAMVLTALGAVAALSTLAPVVGLLRRKRHTVAHRLSERVVLNHAAQVLGEALDAGRGAGWTPDRLADAHAAARLVAAVATGTGIREHALGHGAAVPEGRLAVRRSVGRQGAALTTHVTTAAVNRALEALPAAASATTRSRIERLRDALDALTRARYGAAEHLDAGPVDEAVGVVRALATEMAREKLTSPREWFRRPVPTATPTPEF